METTTTMGIVELSGVTKRFRDKVAVDNIDLQVPENAIYGFIGPNGSGKTTTIRMILRIFEPDDGTVTVLGETSGATADDRLGYLPEERGLYKRMKVRDIISFYASLKGHRNCRHDIDMWLEKLEASEWSHKRVDALSKGMAQKIQFIVAVIAKPKLLILDEPFSGLDPVNMEVIRDIILELRENGTTIIFSTHDMEMAERLCDTIFMFFEGRKILNGTLAEIQSQYPLNRVSLRLAENSAPLSLPTGIVESTELSGNRFELTLGDEITGEQLLQQLAPTCSIEQFEVVRPSLHDIFVSIVRPDRREKWGTSLKDVHRTNESTDR
jgi:ABC-2 type transport system ATP-binding protein